MHKAIATVSVSGALEEKLTAIAAAKFDGIEVFDSDLVASPLRPVEVARRCADLGLSIDLFQPLRDVEGVDPQQFPQTLRRVGRKLDVMEQLGATTLLACSNATPSAVGDADLSAEQLGAVGDLAQEHGFTVAFEALAWGTHINRVSHAWDLVRRVDHPSVALAVDTFHLLARGDDATALHGIPGDRIAFLQVADAPVLAMDVLQWSRHHRVFPGQGSFDLAPVVAAVVEAGYRGPLSLEIFSDVVREADPHVTALDAMRSLLHLEEELRHRWDGAAAGPDKPQRPRIELFDPPPAPSEVEPAFVEVATHGPDLDRLLAAMGFHVAGRHRTKPVTWWRNGGANVLLNGAGDLEDRWATAASRPSITGIGLAVDDVPAFAARRSALLWPGLPLRHGPGEAVIAGVDSPTGIHTFVTGRPGQADDWQRDFVAVADPTADGEEEPGAGWVGIDHVGYAVPFRLSEAEISFHRTLFGMLPGAVSEFTDPRGRVRSRVMRPPTGALRIVLNVTEGLATRAGGPAGINQVAFACPDVLRAARAMRAAGVGLLEVPDNYYDDLAARFDLPAARIAELRAEGVMYDRDERGEFLHVYTRRIAGAFYVEVLQRLGGYDGYGAANTPVRLAAQAAQVRDARPA
ncbi:MAG TPA: TIM barrel protein [Intrasporangium sp.]|uniref:sugar phosphate isomerase/epimerase and 4-hydroxyphenylpyruvate domain-containing protein n=1 Tax=Intrasporangium sp. TaxID=1925024 RepID=UPI002D76E9A2|nr:TIM barrel protein [Intrasporangium sp.]HET7398654.1 TIM barrel protein [Intrasporangium sp.]